MSLVRMYFGAGALTDKQKAELSNKITDLISEEIEMSQTSVKLKFIWPMVVMTDLRRLLPSTPRMK